MTHVILQTRSYNHYKIDQENFPSLSDNQMKSDTEKCHVIMTTNQSVNVQLGGSLIEGIVKKC